MSAERNIADALAFRTEDGQRALAVADVDASARRVVADVVSVSARADSLQWLQRLSVKESDRAVAAVPSGTFTLTPGTAERRPAEQEDAIQKASTNRPNCALVFTRALLPSRRTSVNLFRLTLRNVHLVERATQSAR